MPVTHCLVDNCKTTLYNKPSSVSLLSCPQSSELRNEWLKILTNRCSIIDWRRSKICSRHFEQKYFDSQRKLKDKAVPTIFTARTGEFPKTKVDGLLAKLSQAELQTDIKSSYATLTEPSDLEDFVRDDLTCEPDAPMEAKLWLVMRKQENLIVRLKDLVVKSKKHVEVLQNFLEGSATVRKEIDRTIEVIQHIIKFLQKQNEEKEKKLTALETT